MPGQRADSRTMKRCGYTLVVVFALTACFDEVPGSTASSGEGLSGESGTNGEAGTEGDGDPTTDGPGECVCVATVPGGWLGPGAIDLTPVDQTPTCAGAFADMVLAAGANFSVEASECDCSCELVNASCPTSGTLQIWDDAGCNGDPQYTIALGEDEACTSIADPNLLPGAFVDPNDQVSAILSNEWFSMAAGEIQGSCQSNFNEAIGDAGFALNYALCAAVDSPEPCASGDGICVPVPSSPLEPNICVWQPGDLECPGEFSQKTLLYLGYDDTRACSSCECGEPQGDCVDESYTLIEINDGECVNLFSVNPSSCSPSNSSDVEAASFHAGGLANPSCSGPGTSTLSGDATPHDPLTLCCTQ